MEENKGAKTNSTEDLNNRVLVSELKIKNIKKDLHSLQVKLEELQRSETSCGKEQIDLVESMDRKIGELKDEASSLFKLEESITSSSLEESRNSLVEESEDTFDLLKYKHMQRDKSIGMIKEQRDTIDKLLEHLLMLEVPEKYRCLPDEDLNWRLRHPEIDKTTQSNSNLPEHVTEEKTPLTYNKPKVKFDYGPKGKSDSSIGLTASQLRVYAKDPFWLTTRWCLFVIYWIFWVCFLIGSIYLAITASQCAPNSFHDFLDGSPIVVLERDSGYANFKKFEIFIDVLKKYNVRTIVLGSALEHDMEGNIQDFRGVNSNIGRISNFRAYIKLANESGIRVFLEIDPSHTSYRHDWFNKSIQRENPFTTYYLWTKKDISPNQSNATWKFNKQRNQYYHYRSEESQPSLNYHDQKVVDEFSSILTHWISLGIKGFRLVNSCNLTMSGDETSNMWEKCSRRIDLLRKWLLLVKNKTDGQGVLTLKFNEKPAYDNKDMQDLKKIIPYSVGVSSVLRLKHTAAKLALSLSKFLKFSPGVILDWTDKVVRAWNEKHPDQVESLILMTSLLPFSSVLDINQILSLVEPSKNLEKLSKIRSGDPFLRENIRLSVLNNGTILLYERKKPGNRSYFVAYNSADGIQLFDLSIFEENIPKKVKLDIWSINYDNNNNSSMSEVTANNIPISPKSTIILYSG